MKSQNTDNNITELLKTDLDKGFRLVVEKYSSRLYWHIRRLVILHEDADDALKVTFHKKLKEVLPPVKVIRFYQAENQYKAQLLNELQNNRPQQRVNPNRGF